mmetsp:Transcript_21826/g.62182  ORF Transcript_21826/g.62182 Transcript_21826/m.62182 type:complete len:91 (+) Transcript_21826:659-931(+)
MGVDWHDIDHPVQHHQLNSNQAQHDPTSETNDVANHPPLPPPLSPFFTTATNVIFSWSAMTRDNGHLSLPLFLLATEAMIAIRASSSPAF